MSPHLGRLLDDMTVVERVSPTTLVLARAWATRASACELRDGRPSHDIAARHGASVGS